MSIGNDGHNLSAWADVPTRRRSIRANTVPSAVAITLTQTLLRISSARSDSPLHLPQAMGSRAFKEAVKIAAEESELKDILGATPYSMRRGGISLRLRAEDAQTVAKECGTSLQMLDAHYAFAIDDLRRFGPRRVQVEWSAAREARSQT